MATPITIDYVYGAEISKNVLTGLNNTVFSYQRTSFEVNRYTDVIGIIKNFLNVSGKDVLNNTDREDDWDKTAVFVSTSARYSAVPWNMETRYLDEIRAHNTVHVVIGSSACGEFIRVSVGLKRWTGYNEVNEAIKSSEMLVVIKNRDFKDRY